MPSADAVLKSARLHTQNWAPEPWGQQVCPRWLQRALLGAWVARRWAGPLTLTPCDLWRFLGPTGLWLIGDSQVRRNVVLDGKGCNMSSDAAVPQRLSLVIAGSKRSQS
jgi:hypothetical protein